MKKNSLVANQGLSLSQAQSVSNLCNQRANEILNQLSVVNNAEKTIKVDGETYITVAGNRMPVNVVELIEQKAKLNACQAFLMENIKAKDEMLKAVKLAKAEVDIAMPNAPKTVEPLMEQQVDESFGWEQLSVSEMCEFLEAEAYSAHIGQFIHNGSVLDRLRKELPNIPSVEWMTIKDGVKTPVKVKVHHDSAELLQLHEELAGLHRQREQRVNYYKAKVKNLVTEENARIAKFNADCATEANKQNELARAEYNNAVKAYGEKVQEVRNEFEKLRQEKIREIASMRIKVDARFQDTVNMFLSKLSDKPEDKE